MADFLLVHGSCHGAWCWRDLVPALNAKGHAARTIDLPGHGDGRAADTVTLEETCRAVANKVTADTIVLGHSWAGFPITGAVEYTRPKALIYLCAYVPISGMSLVDMRKAGPRQTIGTAAVKSSDGHSYTISTDRASALFYHDCSPDTSAFAQHNLCPQPIRPQTTPITRPAIWQDIPKAYVRCTDDQTIPPEYQAAMVADWPRHLVVDLPTSHSPFLAAPEQLAACLDHLVLSL